jgi:competence protein ComEC
LLLTGDLGPVGQAALLRRDAVQPCLVLKAPHHGSRAVLPEFVTAAAPRIVVVTENPVGATATLEKSAYVGIGAEWLATGDNGAIHVTTDGVRYWVGKGQ